LKHETFLQDCADAFVMLAKNTSMTGAKVQVGKWNCFLPHAFAVADRLDAGLNIQGA